MGWIFAFWLLITIWTLESTAPAVGYLVPMLATNLILAGAGYLALAALHALNVHSRARRFPIADLVTPQIAEGEVRWIVSPERTRETVRRLGLDRRVHVLGVPLTVLGLITVLFAAGAHTLRDLTLLTLGTVATLGYGYLKLYPGFRIWQGLAVRLAAKHRLPMPAHFEASFDAEIRSIGELRKELYGAALVTGIRDGMRARLVADIRNARNEILSDPTRLAPVVQRILDDLGSYRVALEVERAGRREGRRRRERSQAPPGQEDTIRNVEHPVPEDYDLLGVGEDATDDEIRRAFGRLAKRLHPDRHPDLTSGPMSVVNAAYNRIRTHRERLAAAERQV